MIRLDRSELNGEKCQFRVEFMTPIGLFTNVDSAVDAVRGMDLDPLLCVKAVAVAYTPTHQETCP